MPIYANKEAQTFWNANTKRSRALAASRFCHLKTAPDGSDDASYRDKSANQIAKGMIHQRLLELRSNLHSEIENLGGVRVFAKLEHRLILNAAGGVIENGGICLDRNSGVPFIPGSAVKGAARRHAIWQLSQQDDLTAKTDQLVEVCLIFGYGDQEWKAGRKPSDKHLHGGAARSDFWLAMVPLENAGIKFDTERDARWKIVTESAQAKIQSILGTEKFPQQLSGCIAFLPAFPDRDPSIDLDIITCHHPDYYGKSNKTVATDDEDPNPVIFPTVAKGATFHFPLLKCQSFASDELLQTSKRHLCQALQLFGLGAKTNAGYGWFSIDEKAAIRAAEEAEINKGLAELEDAPPDAEITNELQMMREKNQLAGKLNAYAIDEQFIDAMWPKDSSIKFEIALFEYIKANAQELANTKKGLKAMNALSKKLKRSLSND